MRILDQTLLPHREVVLALHDAADTAAAIRRLAVRGAPLIGVAAAYGLAMEVARDPGALESGWRELRGARPTAVNLAWAVDRVRGAVLAGRDAREEAEAIHAEDVAASAALGAHGADLLAGRTRLMTHCNAGALAASGRGSALSVLATLHDRAPIHVTACEARPLLQGARLTVWELRRLGIPHALCVDAAAAGLIRTSAVEAVVVGADRIAANGDVANKVGTYGLALAAHAAQIPLVVAAPTSTLDPALASGAAIEIEERDADEVRHALGQLLTMAGTPARNPAFDVTPAHLVTAIVTEQGVWRPSAAT